MTAPYYHNLRVFIIFLSNSILNFEFILGGFHNKFYIFLFLFELILFIKKIKNIKICLLTNIDKNINYTVCPIS